MKTMKNVLMILLGAALVLSLAGVGAVAAADSEQTINKNSESKTGEITVSYTIGESYSVTIPADVVISEPGTPDTGDFKVNSATMGSASNLKVTVESTYGWKMKRAADDNENVIPYTMTCDGAVTNEDGTVTIYNSGDSVIEAEAITNTLSFMVSEDTTLPTMAGTYTDTLTFTVTHTETT